MNFNVQDLQKFLQCPRRVALDAIAASPPPEVTNLFPYLKQCILRMYSEELANKTKLHFRRVITHWDKVFWAQRENSKETSALSLKGLEFLKHFYDRIYLQDANNVAMVDMGVIFCMHKPPCNGVDLHVNYDIISVDKQERIHLSCLTDSTQGDKHPAHDLATRVLCYTLSANLGRPVYAVHKYKIDCLAPNEHVRSVYFNTEDLASIPDILKHVSSGLANKITVPVYSDQCSTCPHFLCDY